MPNVSIFEKDLTTPASNQISSNIAYVPGYAIMGPINEPTLCTTLAQFQEKFGYKPYRFINEQKMPHHFPIWEGSSETFAFAGDVEKSYIYAVELLNNGLPVLFERYMLPEKIDQFMSAADIDFLPDEKGNISTLRFLAKNPGAYGENIKYSFDIIRERLDQKYTILNYNSKASILTSTVNENKTLSIDVITPENYEEYDAYNDNDGNYSAINLTTAQIGGADAVIVPENIPVDSKIILIAKEYATSDVSFARKGSNISNNIETSDRLFSNCDTLSLGDELALGSLLNVIKQDADGSYVIEKLIIDGSEENVYKLNLELAINNNLGINSSKKEYFEISFNPSSPIFYENIKSDIVDIKIANKTFDNQLNTYTYDYIYKPSSYALDFKAQNILSTGKLVLVGDKSEDEFAVSDMYSAMLGRYRKVNSTSSDGNVQPTAEVLEGCIFDKLADKGEYDIKFITSGAYPTFEYGDRRTGAGAGRKLLTADNLTVAQKMLQIAGTRGDCTALIDHLPDLKIRGFASDDNNSLLSRVNDIFDTAVDVGSAEKREDGRKYGAMYTPWCICNIKTQGINTSMPASFMYLASLAESSKTNENWYAVAGVTRGLARNLVEPLYNITGAEAQAAQSDIGISINPITNIKPYGYCIWGNRTLNKNNGLVASSFMNIRMLANDVKKAIYKAAKKLTFELNSDILWVQFRSEIEPLLDKMISGNGLLGYKLIKKSTNKKATIAAIVRLYPVEAIEDWDIDVELADGYVSTSE